MNAKQTFIILSGLVVLAFLLAILAFSMSYGELPIQLSILFIIVLFIFIFGLCVKVKDYNIKYLLTYGKETVYIESYKKDNDSLTYTISASKWLWFKENSVTKTIIGSYTIEEIKQNDTTL